MITSAVSHYWLCVKVSGYKYVQISLYFPYPSFLVGNPPQPANYGNQLIGIIFYNRNHVFCWEIATISTFAARQIATLSNITWLVPKSVRSQSVHVKMAVSDFLHCNYYWERWQSVERLICHMKTVFNRQFVTSQDITV